MFKGLITKTVKGMIIDPIMNPTQPEPAQNATSPTEQAERSNSRSEHDPEIFDAPGRAPAFDPDSFDSHRPIKSASAKSAPRTLANPAESRALIAESWDVDLPFYPGEGSSCGDQCRCTWLIEKRWSAENGCDAIVATWVTAAGPDVCQDCADRAREWQAVFIRPAFD